MKAQAFTAFCTLSSKLTIAQRAFARVVYDGLEPVDLPADERALARDIFGAVETVPAVARRVIVQVKGRDAGGSRLGAERCAHLGLTMPIDRIGQQELAYIVFGGPKLRHARIGLRHARNALKVRGAAILEDSKDGFTIRRHDGRRVRFEAFAASRGGDTVRGVPIVAAMLDEAGFYYDEASGVANAEAIFGAIIPRLLPGGQVLIISSPWAESGLLYTEFTRNHGAPVTALAALCPTGVMRDDAETLSMIAVERERDPENARRELDAEFMPTGSGHYFDHYAVGRCPVTALPLVTAPPHDGWTVIGGYDPAYVRDAAEGVVVRTNGTAFEVVELFTRIPAKGKPLVPSEVDREFAELLVKHGGKAIATDQHYQESVRENVGRAGVWLVDVPGSNAGKVEVFAKSRDLIHNDQVRWSEGHRRLTRQLREIISKPLPGGLIHISSPRRRGDHGDAVPRALGCSYSRRT
ncbi:MAG: hypothetical protein WDO69_24380 [Pseudomonadota bacterium]